MANRIDTAEQLEEIVANQTTAIDALTELEARRSRYLRRFPNVCGVRKYTKSTSCVHERSMRNLDESKAVVNCPRQRPSISLHPIPGGAVMPATKPNNQTTNPERMVRVLEQRVRLQDAAPCKVAESGASALVLAGLAQWINRGTAIRLCGDWPSKAA
jgi:hypothetical protein